MFVFGDGDCGQLGLGEEVTERLRPFPVSVDGKKVSGGVVWMRVLRADGPSPLNATPPRRRRCSTRLQQRAPSSPSAPPRASSTCAKQVLQIACGGMHTVALTEDRMIYSWGVNDEGALGRETGARLALAPKFVGFCWAAARRSISELQQPQRRRLAL